MAVVAAPLLARAQKRTRGVPVIGFLGAATPEGYRPQVEAFRAGLREAGYVEGKNILIEYRWAEGDYGRLPALAAELAALNVNVIVTHATPGTRAAMRATTSIPIVMATNGDAVAQGLVASLARPGGNVTGSTFFQPELMVKRVELLKMAAPHARRVAVLLNPSNPTMDSLLREISTPVRELGIDLHAQTVRQPEELSAAFAEMARAAVQGLLVREDAMYIANAKLIAELAASRSMASVGFKEFAEVGGLLGYGANFLAMFRRAAYFVDKILKGTKAAELPVEQATQFDLVVNRSTADALGLVLPRRLLVRAHRVIG